MIQNYPTDEAIWKVVMKDGFGDMVSGYPMEYTVPGHFTEKWEMIRDSKGEEVLGKGVFRVHPDDMPQEAYLDDRVTLRGKEYVICSISRKKGMTGQLAEVELR